VPAPDFRDSIGVGRNKILIVMRPPSTVGNYHDNRSEELFGAAVEYFSSSANVECLLITRGMKDAELIPASARSRSNVRILEKAVDGLQLIWNADLIVSGGGTMNRESALLGVPTFSIFTGRRPFLDEHLQELGKLKFIESPQEVRSIAVQKRDIPATFAASNTALARVVTDIFEDIRN
jgi:predicted glycosyltransferase